MEREADFAIAGLSMWVEGPQKYTDGQVDTQWLEIRAVAKATGSRIEIAGPFLRRMDFRQFRSSLTKIFDDLSGTASLGGLEPDLELSVDGDGMGHVKVTVEMTPDYMNQAHKISWTIDQTELVEPLKQLRVVLVTTTLAARMAAKKSRDDRRARRAAWSSPVEDRGGGSS